MLKYENWIKLTEEEFYIVDNISEDQAKNERGYDRTVDIKRGKYRTILEGNLGELAVYKLFGKNINHWIRFKNSHDEGYDILYSNPVNSDNIVSGQIKATRYKYGNLMAERYARMNADELILVLGTTVRKSDGLYTENNDFLWNVYGYISKEVYLKERYYSNRNSGFTEGYTVDRIHFQDLGERISNPLDDHKVFFGGK